MAETSMLSAVSNESLREVLKELEPQLASASLELARELFGVLEILDDSAGLRRALTDPSREGEEKVALLGGLVSGKISAAGQKIVESLAQKRWGQPRDIADALETVAATVAIAVAEKDQLAGLQRLERDLFNFIHAVNSSHEVQRALTDPQAGAEAKAELALKLVPGASAPAQLLIAQAAAHPRGLPPTALVERFLSLAADRQQRWIATVTVAQPLSTEQLQRLNTGLNKLYGRDLTLNTVTDPSLIGGLRVTVGDEVVDASMTTRLSDLRRQLAS